MLTLLKTKTTWAGIVSIVTGVGMLITGKGENTAEAIQLILGGFGMIFIRHSIAKNGGTAK